MNERVAAIMLARARGLLYLEGQRIELTWTVNGQCQHGVDPRQAVLAVVSAGQAWYLRARTPGRDRALEGLTEWAKERLA